MKKSAKQGTTRRAAPCYNGVRQANDSGEHERRKITANRQGAAPDPYLATWYDPTIRGRRTVDEVIGGDYTATLAVQASNLSSITLQIEGYNAWLRQDYSYLYGNRDTYYDYGYGFRYEAADLSAWNSATLSLANVSVPEGADVEDYQLPISVSVLVDTAPSLLETYNLSQTNAEGDSGNALFRTHPTWSNEYALQFETLIGNALANCRITITAIYEDGTSEAGVYVIAPVADFSQRYAQYLDNQDVYHDEVLRLQSEGLVDEARAFQMPKMPALFTITRVG